MSQATEERTLLPTAESLNRASDLDRCAQEPIHIIGHIQSHGMLFAMSEPDLIVRQVSANVSALLGMSPDTLLNQTFEAVLGAQQFQVFRSLTLSQEALEGNALPLRLARGALAVLCVTHRHDGVLIAELELQEGAYSFEPLSLNAHIRLPLSRLELASGISELSELAASEIRRLSGFDRALVYRFDEEWNGEVIAESAVPSPISYLGLRFPAADIPAQARRLFLQNRLRAIADVDASPVPIVPEAGSLTGRPLDLTFSFLRSPALVHLEYLRNMGVRSSLVVSIVAHQRLWGMIACHHTAPRHVDYSTRSVCELIGQVLGSQVALRMDNAALQSRLAFRSLLDNYLTKIDATTSLVFANSFLSQPLLELFSADGLILSLAGVISAHGHSLEPAALLPVISSLRELSSNGIASSNVLSALDASVISDSSDISGALYVGLSEETGDYLLLLRRELVRTVTWAGNPDKSVNTDAQGRLHPRASFLAWQETVHGRSSPWSELELEGARSLRTQLLQRRASLESAWSKLRFRFLADSVPQLIWTARPDGNVDYCNQRWVSYTGNSLEQLIDWGWGQLVHSDDLRNCVDSWNRAIATECDYDLEYRLKRASDGAYRWHHARAFPLRNHRGEISHWVGAATDVEDQKQARHELIRARDELQNLLERFQLVVEASPSALVMVRGDGLITLVNSQTEKLFGYARHELLGRSIEMLLPDRFRGQHGAHVAGFFSAPSARAMGAGRDLYGLRKDGSEVPVEVGLNPIDASGARFVLASIIDITERKQAEEALIKAGALQSAIFNSANFSSIATDAKGVIQIFNVGAERMLGYKASEVVDRITPADISDPHEVIVRATELSLELATAITPGFEAMVFKASRGIEDIYELTYIRKDGSRFPAVVSVTALRDAEDKIIGYLLIGTDNTARKQAETALRESEVAFGTMIEAVPQIVWITRADGFNIYFSQKWMDYTGLTLEESLGHGWNKPFHPDDQQRAWEAWQRATKTIDGTYRVECRLRRADGAYRWFLILGVRQLDSDGTTLKWFGTCTDITLAKLSEGELKAANQELQHFAYVAAHDLKAPLRAINNSAKWLEEDLEQHLTEETREYLDVLRSRVKRMEKLLDDLLEYARIGRVTDDRYDEAIKGDLLMEDVLALLPLEGFTVEVSPNFANIEVYLMPLQQILTNLIGNAIKHHHRKTGKIAVTVENDGDFYAFAVKDDGPGISAQFHEQVFEMFRTLRPRDQVEGSGMGLAMVRKHIDMSGGTLRLESREGQGSTFRFTWPKRPQLRKERE